MITFELASVTDVLLTIKICLAGTFHSIILHLLTFSVELSRRGKLETGG